MLRGFQGIVECLPDVVKRRATAGSPGGLACELPRALCNLSSYSPHAKDLGVTPRKRPSGNGERIRMRDRFAVA